MMKKMKNLKFFKLFLWLCSAVILAALIFCGAAGIKWYRVSKSGEQVTIVSAPAIRAGEDGVQLGEKFAVTAEFRLPWGVNLSLLTAEPADGSQLCAEPKFILKNIRWGYTLWSGDVELQSYAEGEIRDGRMNASFSNNQNLSMKIPAFKSNPVPVDSSDLAVASRIDRKASVPYLLYTVVSLAVLAVIALAVFLIRKHRRALKMRALTPWELAVNAIHLLIGRVRGGNVPLETSVAELTDIVREYMERRFHLRAGRQTTAEFLGDLERGGGSISESQRDFLKEFLSAADMVKFARLPADRALFENAAEKAERLVTETIPAEENKKEQKP